MIMTFALLALAENASSGLRAHFFWRPRSPRMGDKILDVTLERTPSWTFGSCPMMRSERGRGRRLIVELLETYTCMVS